MSKLRYPDGVDDAHVRTPTGLVGHASLLSLLILGALLALAMTGLLAGDKATTRTLDTAAARITVRMPERLRNGVFFETRVEVTARRDIAELVIAIPPSLWQDMTINTVIPAATEEAFEDGRFRLTYGKLAAGDSFVLKIDGQINPPLTLGTSGEVALFDGDRLIGQVPIRVGVLP